MNKGTVRSRSSSINNIIDPTSTQIMVSTKTPGILAVGRYWVVEVIGNRRSIHVVTRTKGVPTAMENFQIPLSQATLVKVPMRKITWVEHAFLLAYIVVDLDFELEGTAARQCFMEALRYRTYRLNKTSEACSGKQTGKIRDYIKRLKFVLGHGKSDGRSSLLVSRRRRITIRWVKHKRSWLYHIFWRRMPRISYAVSVTHHTQTPEENFPGQRQCSICCERMQSQALLGMPYANSDRALRSTMRMNDRSHYVWP